MLLLFSVMAPMAAAQGITSDQNIYQNSENSALVYGNNSNVNQSNVQNASQNAEIYGNASLNQSASQRANQSAQVFGYAGSNQTSSQGASQTAQTSGNASNVQSITQNAYQTWNIQNYWTNNQTTTVSAEQRSILEVRTEQFLSGYSNMRMYVMPYADFETVSAESSAQVFVLDVSSGNAVASAGTFPGAVWIPLASLSSRLSEIPSTSTVVVVSDNDIDSAVAVTTLRMYGYNAWILPSGICNWQQSGGWMAQRGITGTAYAGTAASTTQAVSSYQATSGSSTGTAGY